MGRGVLTSVSNDVILHSITSGDTCPGERGHCVTENGEIDSDAEKLGVIEVVTTNTTSNESCLHMCSTDNNNGSDCALVLMTSHNGTEYTCYLHQNHVIRGNGDGNHTCWIRSKWTGVYRGYSERNFLDRKRLQFSVAPLLPSSNVKLRT